ncbi:Phosphotransferase enzyme family protein [Asanoa hainanensis]|uniref:Phosphotransferase enzyme family protein n=1 Tax=Asanoa hainanensis TaxID=560556 RepID=A0A239L713_9ACTN|nr:phosphotransferase [Asanoa hainanensis]SNT25698.1 Phosphotransferase enzyme family protein [Asanoa hainanensis]
MELIASGRDCDVYALGPDRVLRRSRHGRAAAPEAELMSHLAAAGYPVPLVYDADGADLVMERLEGRTLLAAAIEGSAGPETAAAILADLHRRLHALPARTKNDNGDRILHLDLHPDNVMLTPRGPVLFDWANAAEGPPDRDVAMTLLIMAQVTLWEHEPTLATVAKAGFAELQAQLPRPSAAALAWVLDQRRANPTMSATELAQLDQAAALV